MMTATLPVPFTAHRRIPLRCTECGGTVLAPARFGGTRGSCHCARLVGFIRGKRFYDSPAVPVRYEHFIVWEDVEVTSHDTAEEAWQALFRLNIEHRRGQESQ